MNYLIVEDGIITNIIVAEKDYAEKMGFLPYYEGATMGEKYDPLTLEKLQKNLETFQADTDNLLVDQEYRLTLLELSITEEE